MRKRFDRPSHALLLFAAVLAAGCTNTQQPAPSAPAAQEHSPANDPKRQVEFVEKQPAASEYEDDSAAAEVADGQSAEQEAADDSVGYTEEMADTTNYPKAIISTGLGELTVELWDDVAPKHVENFLKLAREGFYDNLTFHRIIPGFVVQGGCPHGTGTGGPGWTVDAEFNDRQHVPGTLSMARSGDPNSAGSQFFICLTREKCRHLDGQYTAFGQVIEGLDIVEKLGAVKTGRGDRPIEPLALNGVRPIE